MTEAVEGPPLDAELLAVDTIARFMFTDMNIFQFGQAIDAIDAVEDGLSSSARTVANLFNEPDTQTVALQEPPVLTHPMAQERFKYLEGALNFDDYLRSSQSQSQSGGSAAGPSQAQSSITVSPPPPNQQQAQNRRNAVQQHRTRTSQSRGDVIPASRSTSPAVPPPTLPSTLPATHASNARPRQQLQIPARASSSRAQLQIPVRASRSPSPRRSALPRRMGDYVVEPSSDSPVAHSKRKASLSPGNASNTSGDEEGLRNPKLRKGLTLEISSSDSDDLPSQVHKRPRTAKAAASAGASATTTSKAKRANPEELRQIAAAKKVPEDQRIGPQVSAVLAQRQAHQPQSPQTPEASSSLSPRRSPQRLAAPVFNNTEASSSTAAIFGKTAPHYIGDIPLSKPARMSILGALSQLSEGWEGFEWVRSYRSGKRNTVKEQWRCLACTGLYTCSRAGQNTNLKTHRTTCPLIKDQDGQIVPQAQGGAAARKPSALTSTASSTVIGYTGRSVSGWLNGQQVMHPDLTRRLGLIAVVKNSLPFTHLSSPAHKALIKSIDARATIAMVSPSTVRRDLTTLHDGLQADIQRQLHNNDSLMAMSHDAWTNKGFQHSFMAITGSYVNSQWEYREVLLSFDVVKEKHTGATFSGHVLRTLANFDLADKWLGSVTSDSTGTNHRMMDLLETDVHNDGLQKRRQDQANITKKEKDLARLSCSSFPRASMRHSGQWTAQENKVLCMNHHINIAVRDGFARFGVPIKTKAQQKVINLRPKPIITVQDENGNPVQVDSDSSDDEGEEPENEEPENEDEGLSRRMPSLKDKGKCRERDRETIPTSTTKAKRAPKDQASEEDTEEEDDTDQEDYEPDMQPSDDELLSDDGGGPDANDVLLLDKPNLLAPKNAIAKLEAFVTAVHRGSQRRADFRKRMEKEFYQNRELAQAPFPSKPNTTRWNSHFSMIRMALPIREAIDAHCRAYIGSVGSRRLKFGEYLLTPAQWRQLELLQPILKLAAAATKDMEQASGTLYMVLDYHAILRDEIERLIGESQNSEDLDSESKEEVKKFLEAVEAKLGKYRELALKNRLTLVAAILHPLHRLDMFAIAFPEHAEEAEKALRDMLKELLGSVDAGKDKEATPTTKAKSPEWTEPDVIAAARARRMQQSSDARARQPERNEPDEVARYLDASFCPWRESDVSPYKWWKDNEQVFPNLAKLARIILAIPGTSSSVERVFSQAALVSTNRRARLSAKSIAQLVSTKHWLHHGADELVGLDPEARRCAESIARLPDV